MSSGTGPTTLIQRLRAGDSDAARRLFELYQYEIRAMARRMRTARTMEDDEDVVIVAFAKCFAAIQKGKYPKVVHGKAFKRMLKHIAKNRMIDFRRKEKAQKRTPNDGTMTQVPFHSSVDDQFAAEDVAISDEWPPELLVAFSEQLDCLIDRLDAKLRHVAELRLEGFTHAEISEEIGRSIPTVERRCRLIRQIWEHEYDDEGG
ncbi:MAG: sigma-70 family RNA polymerase sigma factor [Planctomycetota bacterium]